MQVATRYEISAKPFYKVQGSSREFRSTLRIFRQNLIKRNGLLRTRPSCCYEIPQRWVEVSLSLEEFCKLRHELRNLLTKLHNY